MWLPVFEVHRAIIRMNTHRPGQEGDPRQKEQCECPLTTPLRDCGFLEMHTISRSGKQVEPYSYVNGYTVPFPDLQAFELHYTLVAAQPAFLSHRIISYAGLVAAYCMLHCEV